MKGIIFIAALVAIVALTSGVQGNSFAVTKTDVAQGLGEFKVMQAITAQNAGNCYTCSAPCNVAGKGCCSNTIFKQCRQIDGEFCRCTQF